MKSYVYHWTLSPELGVRVDVRITAFNAIVARRYVRRFLVDHDGVDWRIESVSREMWTEAAPEPIHQH